MKRKPNKLALAPLFVFVIAAGIHAGGVSHDNCSDCNRAIGKTIRTVISEETGETKNIIKDSVKTNTLRRISNAGMLSCAPAYKR